MAQLNPYINFKNNTKDAMTFYQSVFGGKLDMTTFKDGGMSQSADTDSLIMHAMLTTPSGFTLMASDTPPHMDYKPAQGISVSLSGTEQDELQGYWNKLAVGAMVTMPLEKAPWGDMFGMLVDTFGISWMVNITVSKK